MHASDTHGTYYVLFSLAGPFNISNGDRNYWKVNPNTFGLDIVQERKDASFFYIVPNESGSVEYEFNIAWDREETDVLKSVAEPDIKVLQMYKLLFLEPNLDFLGHNKSKMQLEQDVDSIFTLKHRMLGTDKKNPTSINYWIEGKDVCYIHCSSGKFRKGYIAAVRRVNPEPSKPDITELKCYTSVNSHNYGRVYMLFQLHPLNPKDIVEKKKEMDQEVCAELRKRHIGSGRSPRAASGGEASGDGIESASVVADLEIREPRLQEKASTCEETALAPLTVAPSL